ncbi:MAG: Ribonuclease E [Phycisphaerae bacterium]|nr:Ribonuclease E [Phycisphaerae bacterium]
MRRRRRRERGDAPPANVAHEAPTERGRDEGGAAGGAELERPEAEFSAGDEGREHIYDVDADEEGPSEGVAAVEFDEDSRVEPSEAPSDRREGRTEAPRREDGRGDESRGGRRRRGRRGGRRARRRREQTSGGGGSEAPTPLSIAFGDRERDRERDRAEPEPSEDDGEVMDVSSDVSELEPSTEHEAELEAVPSDLRRITGPTPGVTREMVINVLPREECRIAVMNEGALEEIYLERASSENHVGNIYKGRVTNVEPSIQAAFVDFGLGKNGFLHVSDLHPQYFPNRAGESEDIGRKTPRRDRPPIQKCLRRGQEIVVQIIKEGIGTKGPTLSTYLSIPGRFLVMLPGMSRVGVSRKVEDPELRDKLRDQMDGLELPDDMGFIARTAAQDRTKKELQADLQYLTRLWRAVEQRIRHERAPAELYRESDLVIRTIRDVFTSDIGRIVIDDREVAERARDFLAVFSPRARDSVVLFDSREPIFHKWRIEAELEQLHSRYVPLKSGGSLVIDSTEALVAIDVNSGKYRAEEDAETTAFNINKEAADEIPRQLRLRDLGGVIICDFIDMRIEKHRREIERTLVRNLKAHKERAKVLRMSRFGIIEMTRQRQRASLTRNVYHDCAHCRGRGLVKTAESVALDVMRLIQLAATREHIATIEVATSNDVAHLLQNRKRSVLNELEMQNRRIINIRPDASYAPDQVQINYYDARGRPVPNA